MSRAANKLIQAASGNAGGAPVYVDDVFSTYLYEGNGSTQTIANGIDLSGESGLVWIKNRDQSDSHILTDTERGATKILNSNSTAAESTDADTLTAFNSNGFSIGADVKVNTNGEDYVSWTFRKQPGLCDIVTYSGNGSARTISHNLGSVPGMILVKSTSHGENWFVFHTSLGPTKSLILESGGAALTRNDWNNTAPTDSVFTVGSFQGVNGVGKDFVAYLFAHDAQEFGTDSDESIIKCGTIAANGSETLGFEPQWLLTKKYDGSAGWTLVDSMRRFEVDGSNYLQANTTGAEATNGLWKINSTGFSLGGGSGNYIYVAIRRPHKPASEFAATDLFNTIARSGNNTTTQVPVGFPVDMFLSSTRSNTWYTGVVFDRLRGKSKFLETPKTAAEAGNTNQFTSFDQDGITVGPDGSGWINNLTPTYVYHLFKRAPGFFDVVIYTGTGSAHDIPHNLGVAPELMILKQRDGTGNWLVYSAPTTANKYSFLHTTVAFADDSDSPLYFDDTEPNSATFRVGSGLAVNQNTKNHIAYLFATAPGISKVGSYTGTGADLDVNCGFSAGARFVLVKRTDSTGDWYFWDSVRGIVAGNDPYLLLNTTAAEVTNADYIDPLSSGFTITSGAPAALNASGGTYLFLAIA